MQDSQIHRSSRNPCHQSASVAEIGQHSAQQSGVGACQSGMSGLLTRRLGCGACALKYVIGVRCLEAFSSLLLCDLLVLHELCECRPAIRVPQIFIS
jgi:hypothetical protein